MCEQFEENGPANTCKIPNGSGNGGKGGNSPSPNDDELIKVDTKK
jgi:hypothetical protein